MSELGIINHTDQTTDAENDKEPALTHWYHPTNPTTFWCGTPRKQGFTNETVAPQGTVKSCPMCSDLDRRFGWGWWWETHCRYFESQCHIHGNLSFHNCIGANT